MIREFMRQNGFGGFGGGAPRPPPKPFPQPEMEAWIRADVASIEKASRASGISADKDELRARFAGTLAVVAVVDPRDKSAKVRVMVSPGRAAEVWYANDALWDPKRMKEGLRVRVCPETGAIHGASRAAGIPIDLEKDGIRAACAGKVGTVLQVDSSDNTAKIRVVDPDAGEATICWFAIACVEPV